MPTFTRQQALAQLDAHNAKQLAQFAREASIDQTDETPSTPRHALAKPGDPKVLRMIPISAKGVSGTIPGSQPHRALRDR